MKYQGFEIIPNYIVGSNICVNKSDEILYHFNGEIKLRKFTKKDVDYYEIFDLSDVPDKFGDRVRFSAEFTIASAKEFIDTLLIKIQPKLA